MSCEVGAQTYEAGVGHAGQSASGHDRVDGGLHARRLRRVAPASLLHLVQQGTVIGGELGRVSDTQTVGEVVQEYEVATLAEDRLDRAEFPVQPRLVDHRSGRGVAR